MLAARYIGRLTEGTGSGGEGREGSPRNRTGIHPVLMNPVNPVQQYDVPQSSRVPEAGR